MSSELEAGFIQAPKSKSTVCFTCFQYQSNQKKSRGTPAFLLVLAISFLLGPLTGSWTFFNLMLFYCGLYLSMVPHELGHLLGAILTRQEVLQVTLGSGGRLYSTKVRGVYFEIRSYPTEGMLFRKYKDRKWLKLRDFITILSGPLANLATAWFLIAVFGNNIEHTSPFDEPAPLFALFCANVVIGLANLWPFSFRSDFGVLHSDGKQLLLIPFMSASQFEGNFRLQAIAASFFALRNNDLEMCERMCADGLLHYPADVNLKLIKSALLISKHDYQGSRALMRSILDDASLDGHLKASAENDIAWSNYMQNDPGLLDEADRHSESAMKSLPWNLAVRSTRGAILIARGRIEEGSRSWKTSALALKAQATRPRSLARSASGMPRKAILTRRGKR